MLLAKFNSKFFTKFFNFFPKEIKTLCENLIVTLAVQSSSPFSISFLNSCVYISGDKYPRFWINLNSSIAQNIYSTTKLLIFPMQFVQIFFGLYFLPFSGTFCWCFLCDSFSRLFFKKWDTPSSRINIYRNLTANIDWSTPPNKVSFKERMTVPIDCLYHLVKFWSYEKLTLSKR